MLDTPDQVTVSCLFFKSSEHCYFPEPLLLPVPRGCILFVMVQVDLRLCMDGTWWIKTCMSSTVLICHLSRLEFYAQPPTWWLSNFGIFPHFDVQKHNLHQYDFITFSSCHGFGVKLQWINSDTINCFGLPLAMYMFFLSLPLLYFAIADCKFQMLFRW